MFIIFAPGFWVCAMLKSICFLLNIYDGVIAFDGFLLCLLCTTFRKYMYVHYLILVYGKLYFLVIVNTKFGTQIEKIRTQTNITQIIYTIKIRIL